MNTARIAGVVLCAWCANVEAVEELMDLSLAELMEVEINLDDAFDVFDGLIETRKVSVASGKRQNTALAPAVTTVITAQDLEASGVRNVIEALSTVPGLYVSVDPLYQPVLVMRGVRSLPNPEVLVMLNGVPLKALDTGNRGLGWRGMPVQAVSRIEIIRGPGSAVHGADAFSGTVNIITKTAHEFNGTEFGARVGSWQTYEAWLTHGQHYGKWEVGFSLNQSHTDGAHPVIQADAQTMLDQRTGSSASLAPHPVNLQGDEVTAHLELATGNWRLRGLYQGLNDLGVGEGTLSKTLDPQGTIDNRRYQVDVIYHNPQVTPNWEVSAEFNYVHDLSSGDWHIRPPGTIMPTPKGNILFPEGIVFDPSMAVEHLHLGVSGFYAGFKRQLVRMGAGYRYEDLYEVTHHSNFGLNRDGTPIPPGSAVVDLTDSLAALYPEAVRKNSYAFVQDTWNIAPHWEVTLGVRYDEYSDFGNTTNPRAALVWQVNPTLTTKLLYGRAFRAPSFRELYLRNTAILVGNPDLKPEIVDTWEWAASWRANQQLNWNASVYRFTIQDKIQYVALNPPLQTPRNIGEQNGYGFEIEARWKMHQRASLLANYSYTKSTLDDHEAGNYPASHAYLRSDWLLYKNWYLDTQLHWYSAMNRSLGDPRPALDGFHTVDLTLRYKDTQTNRWNIALGARNLLNNDGRAPETLEIPNDLPLPGRNFFIELRYRF